MPCSFDGDCELTLVCGAYAGHAAGEYFRALAHEAAQLVCVLIVYVGDLVNAKRANFSAFTHAALRSFSVIHCLIPLSKVVKRKDFA